MKWKPNRFLEIRPLLHLHRAWGMQMRMNRKTCEVFPHSPVRLPWPEELAEYNYRKPKDRKGKRANHYGNMWSNTR